MSVRGADRVKAKLRALKPKMQVAVDDANEKSGKEIIQLAKVLIPEVSGESRAEISGRRTEGGYLMDFGSKAKVIEGRRGPRPFVNPALLATEKRRRNRARRAVRKIIKSVF
jgi:hypothetical protein